MTLLSIFPAISEYSKSLLSDWITGEVDPHLSAWPPSLARRTAFRCTGQLLLITL